MYLCEVINDMHQGINTVADKVEYHEAGIPIIQSKNFTKGFLDLDDVRYLGPEDEEKYSLKYNPHVGDILMANIGTIGKSYVIKEEQRFLIAWNAFLIKPKREYVISEFLKYYFDYLATSKYFDKLLTGGTVKFINKKKIGEILVPECSMDEQMNIVQILSKVEQVIIKRQSQLEELDNLIKSRFVEMFGDPVLNPYEWEQATLKDVAVGKLSYGSGASATEYDGDCRYVRITDIADNGELNNDIKSPDKYDEKYLLNDGDILFARSGATVGKTFRYSKEKHGKSIYAGYLIRLVPDTEKVLADYVFYYTKTEYYASFVKKAQRAVAQPNINAQEYGDLVICIPPIHLQKEFMMMVNQVDKLKFCYI